TRGPQGGLCPTQWDKNSQILLPQPNQKAVQWAAFLFGNGHRPDPSQAPFKLSQSSQQKPRNKTKASAKK
ncbi:hypothetical protein ACSSV1_006021, partial [Labrenzia sp. MBR-25]